MSGIIKSILFCILANLVCATQNYYWAGAVKRFPRYASCPSCHQDWPEALSSPWYSKRENYHEESKYRGHLDNDWTPRSMPRFDTHYERSSRSESPEFAFTGRWNPKASYYSERGNPFEDRRSGRIDPYPPAEASTPFGKPAALALPRPSQRPLPATMTNSPIANSNYAAGTYQARKFPEHGDQLGKFREAEIDRQASRKPSYRDYQDERDLEDYPGETTKDKFLVVYRADRDRFQSRLPQAQGYSKIAAKDTAMESLAGRQSTDMVQRDPYQGLAETIRAKDFSEIRRPSLGDFYPADRSLESLGSGKDREGSHVSFQSHTSQENRQQQQHQQQHQQQQHREENFSAELAGKASRMKDDGSNEESSLKFDPDFLDDIENPPAEPTEQTPNDESDETSTTSKSRIEQR